MKALLNVRGLRLLGIVAVALLVALPAMASTTLGVAGEVTYGITGNGAGTTDAFGNAYINFTMSVDPNNTAVLELFANKLPTISSASGGYGAELIAVPLAYLKSDVGAILGMDPKTIDPVLYAGFGNATTPGYGVTDYGIEDIAALGIGGEASGMNAAEGTPYPYVALNTSVMGMANILLGVSSTALTQFPGVAQQAVIGAYTTIGPVSVEASYALDAANPGWGKGDIGAGALVNYKMGDLALNGTVQIVDKLALTTANFLWSAGVSASYQGNYGGGFSIVNFFPTDAGGATAIPTGGALKATVNADATFAKNLGVNIGAMLNFDPNATPFDSLDASAWTTFGATKLRVGYLYITSTSYALAAALNAPSANGGKGGAYFTLDLPF